MTKHPAVAAVRRQRHCPFGIEVSKEVVWDGWQPGGEYTKQIKLKNVNVKTIKIKHRTPSTQFFAMQYPEQIVLSSGTSKHLPVTFRPLEKGQYDDYIEFATKDGNFRVSLCAVVPDAQLRLPPTVNFGMCAVHDSIEVEFEVENTSDVHTAFQFLSDAPFLIKPASGTLAPRTQCAIKAIFKPTDALVYEMDSTCRLGDSSDNKKKTEIIKLEGIGKRPHLIIRHGKQSSDQETLINFENVGLGFSSEKSFDIINSTPVSAPFQIIHPSRHSSLDSVFACSVYHGVVPADSSRSVKVTFTPANSGLSYVDNFEVIAVGATSRARIKCTGQGEGPNVEFESNLIHFGVTSVNEVVSRSFKLRNTSKIPAIFQFQLDADHGVFHLDVVNGVLAPHSSQMIVVQFRPIKPISYYRKLVCLVHNQGPIVLELLGTCHTKEVQPVVLSRKHVQTSLANMRNGFSWYPPEHLEELVKQGKLRVSEADDAEPDSLVAIDNEVLRNLEAPHPTDLSGYEGFFFGDAVGPLMPGTPHISMDVSGISFGRCANVPGIFQKTLNVTNHTHGRVSCIWMNAAQSEFSVEPEELDILPQATVSFKVLFKPIKMSQFFSVELEGYVFYKTMRDHRLFDERMLTLPWCITTTASGHTFPKHCETYLPVCSWDKEELVFPPQVSPNESLYRTCLLTNNGDTPIHFNFQPEDDQNTIFTCKPCHGLLRGKYQVIVFQMLPLSVGMTETRMVKCLMNDAEKYTKEFRMTVSSEVAQVSLQPNDMIYFKPTCIHATSTQNTSIKNLSRMPLRFEWKIPDVDEPNLKVFPCSGTILANEIQGHEWSFTPGEVTKYLFKIKLLVFNEKGDSKPQKYFIQLIGEGQMGAISCENSRHNFGNIIVGSTGHHCMQVTNESACDLMYELASDQKFVQHISSEQADVENILSLGHKEGLVLAHSTTNVDLTVSPCHRGYYECDISYELRPFSGKPDQVTVGTEQFTARGHLFTVSVEGVYPTLRAVDISGAGCVQQYSKKYLWNLLGLTHFNALLAADPAPKELKYAIGTRHSTRRRMPQTTDARCNFDFGSAAYGSRPAQMTVVIENGGSSDIEWAFRYPTDLQLEMEYWADSGALEEDELHEMYIMDSKLFTVEPKCGKVNCGETQKIKFTYRHESVGVHRLPVLLKLVQGREVLIHFLGTTMQPGEARLHFTSLRHRFDSVTVGNRYPPVQLYQLCNGGDCDIEFQMDVQVLDQLQRDNYNWRVLDCLQPYGYIKAGDCAQIQWIFSPLEAKEYEVNIPISVNGGETTVVSFACAGENPSEAPLPGTPVIGGDEEAVEPYLRAGHRPFSMENQLVKLSKESVSFGRVPLFCRESRLIFIENASSDHVVSYQWLIGGTNAEGIISIQPQCGFLKPSEVLPSRIVLFSEGPPAVHDFDIILEVTDESLMEKYNVELMNWHRKKEEHEHLFIIHESPIKRGTGKEAEQREQQRPGSGKYEVLPPVKSTKKSSVREKSVKKEIEEKLDKKVVQERLQFTVAEPQPPVAFVTHLGVTARTEPVSDFYKTSLQEMNKHFIVSPNAPDAVLTARSRKSSAIERAPAANEERVTLESIIGSLVKDILQDEDFHSKLRALGKEPIPYFGMIQQDANKGTEMKKPRGLVMFENEARSPEARSPELEDEEEEDIVMECDEQTALNISLDRGDLISAATEAETESGSVLPAEDVPPTSMTMQTENEYYVPRQTLKCLSESRLLLHDILENTISNIMSEASLGEISLTTRPRLIALPPAVNRATSA